MATNLFKPYRVTSSQLNSLAIKEGQFIITTDTKMIYADISSSQRIQLGSAEGINIEVSQLQPSQMNEGDIWFVMDEIEE